MSNMLLVQNYLLDKSFNDLISEHGVYASPSKCGFKISLNYSQIESSNSDKLAQQCRGLILSKLSGIHYPFLFKDGKLDLSQVPGQTYVVAYPFNRFFNHGMGEAYVNFDDKKLKVLEKLDGTLIILYYDTKQGTWHVGTRSVPEADSLLNDVTFRQLFEIALKEQFAMTFKQFTSMFDTAYTYMFELTSYYNRVVVKYNETNITLLGARNNLSYDEINIDKLKINVPKVKKYSLSEIDKIIDFVNSTNPIENEGVVICDSNFNRIKVKSASYVQLHRVIDNIGSSDRNLLSLIMNEKDDDVLADLPEKLALKLTKIKNAYVLYAKNVNDKFILLKNQAENSDEQNKRKAFALCLNSSNIEFKAPYFDMYSGKVNSFFSFIEKIKKDGDWTPSVKDYILNELRVLDSDISLM